MAAREFDTPKVTLRRKLGESHQEPASSWPNYPVYGNFPDLSSSTRFVGPLNKHCKNFCERLNRSRRSAVSGMRPPPPGLTDLVGPKSSFPQRVVLVCG